MLFSSSANEHFCLGSMILQCTACARLCVWVVSAFDGASICGPILYLHLSTSCSCLCCFVSLTNNHFPIIQHTPHSLDYLRDCDTCSTPWHLSFSSFAVSLELNVCVHSTITNTLLHFRSLFCCSSWNFDSSPVHPCSVHASPNRLPIRRPQE